MLRLRRTLGFFIGIFGALAILGVFFKIMKWPNYELFMIAGFLGEAAAFVIMGTFELFGALAPSEEGESPASRPDAGVASPSGELSALREDFSQNVGGELEHMVGGLAEEVRQLGTEMRSISEELHRARNAVVDMREKLDRVASGELAADAERLGTGMHSLSAEMGGAEGAVKRMRDDLESMAERFHLFNRTSPAESERQEGQEPLRLPGIVHALRRDGDGAVPSGTVYEGKRTR